MRYGIAWIPWWREPSASEDRIGCGAPEKEDGVRHTPCPRLPPSPPALKAPRAGWPAPAAHPAAPTTASGRRRELGVRRDHAEPHLVREDLIPQRVPALIEQVQVADLLDPLRR